MKSAVITYVAQVEKLIATRTSILTGNNQIFQSADLLPHIDAEISKKLTSNFIGSKKPLTWEGSVDVRDFAGLNVADMDNPAPGAFIDVLHIKEDEGICLKAKLAPDSKPIPSKFKELTGAACNSAAAVQLRVDFFPRSPAQLFTRVAPATTGERSFRYRVPAQVKATLCDSTVNAAGKYICDEAKKTYGSAVFSVAQLGKVISLPATRHSKSLTYELNLIDSTGGLKTFKLGTTGELDPAMIETLGGVAGSIIEARQKGR